MEAERIAQLLLAGVLIAGGLFTVLHALFNHEQRRQD